MQVRHMRLSRLAPLVVLVALAVFRPSHAQVVSQTVSLTGEIGAGFYIGEFNSLDRSGTFNPSAGLDLGAGIKYQIASNFALLATIGYARLSYVVDDYVRAKYGSNFFGPLSNTTYPGSTVELTKLNYINYTRYVLFGQSHFNVSSQLVPYFTLGLGLIAFSATNGLGEELPKNITGDYSSQSLVMPIGGGLQYFLDDRLSLFGQALFYVNSSDYLDGYAHFVDFETTPGTTGPGAVATPPDYPLTLTVGASYAIYLPEQEYQPPVAAAEPPQPQPQPREEADRPSEEPRVDAQDLSAADSDTDGLSDSSETSRFMTNPSNPDSDGDGLRDADEVYRYNTSPNSADTDRDGLSDGDEVLVHTTDPLDADSDNDLLVDGDEVHGTRTDAMYAAASLSPEVMAARQATDPLDPDTDGDGVPDGLDACPTLAGEARLKGCPAVAEAESPTESVAPGYRADFEGITFRPNTDDFDFSRPGTQRDLSRLLSLVNECDDMGVLIEGHTSSEGNQRWNQTLSTLRARRVYDWLRANGVPERKLFGAVGYGSRLPQVAETGSGSRLEDLRSRNRRITALVRKPCR
jgi:outer membrane protein OmpA-like peptidoglycan-associated protein